MVKKGTEINAGKRKSFKIYSSSNVKFLSKIFIVYLFC